MFRKIFPFGRGTPPAGLEALLAEAGVAAYKRPLSARALSVLGVAMTGVGVSAGASLALCASGVCPFGDGLRAAAEGADAAGFGFGFVTVIGVATAGIGAMLDRVARLGHEARKLADEQPDLRPSLEGLAARQRQLGVQLDALAQRVDGLPGAMHGVLAGGLQSIEHGVGGRVAALEQDLGERLEALRGNQPTEALWRLAASLDRLGLELERRIERRLDQHVDGLDERIAALAESARAALSHAPAAHDAPHAPVATDRRAASAAELAKTQVLPRSVALPGARPAAPAPRAAPAHGRPLGSEPSLAAQLRSFTPGEDADAREPQTFDLDARPVEELEAALDVDLYSAPLPASDDGVLDLGRIDEDLTANLGLLEQPDPYASQARTRALGPPPKSAVDHRPEPPAALPKARQPMRPATDPLDLRDGGSRR